MSVVTLIDLRTMPVAAQTFFKAIEAVEKGHAGIGLQYLNALAVCSFPNVAARAKDALARYGAVEEINGGN